MAIISPAHDRVTATEARVHFGEIYRRVTENDETIIIERNGRPGAVLISIEEYEALRGAPAAAGWLDAMRQSQHAFRPFFQKHPEFDVVETIRTMRDERSEQIRDAVSGR